MSPLLCCCVALTDSYHQLWVQLLFKGAERRKWQSHKESVTELCRRGEQTAERIWKKASTHSSLRISPSPLHPVPSFTPAVFPSLALPLSSEQGRSVHHHYKKCHLHLYSWLLLWPQLAIDPDCAASLPSEWVHVWDVLMLFHVHCVKHVTDTYSKICITINFPQDLHSIHKPVGTFMTSRRVNKLNPASVHFLVMKLLWRATWAVLLTAVECGHRDRLISKC